MLEEKLWFEKYRPKNITDCILPDDLKNTFQSFVDNKDLPNLILAGGPGIGKTTIAKAVLNEIDSDYIMINASMDNGIDVVRNEIQRFASSMSFAGGRKFIILDEADNLTQSAQTALRAFIEEYSNNCGFILTCNYKHKIIEALHSRCSVIDFAFSEDDLLRLASKFLKRCCWMLEQESITYDKLVVVELIKKYYPDWRRTINELQRYSSTNSVIDSGILANFAEISIKQLIGYLKEKDFTNMRKWVGENVDNNADLIYRKIYDGIHNYVETSSIPHIILILAKYGFQHTNCADQEVNLAAALVEIMVDADWK